MVKNSNDPPSNPKKEIWPFQEAKSINNCLLI